MRIPTIMVAWLVVAVLVVAGCAPAAPAPTAAPPKPAEQPAATQPPAAKPAEKPAATPPPAAKPAEKPAAKPSAKMQEMIEAAKKENVLNLWSNSPREANIKPLQDAFNERFGLNTQIRRLDMSAGDFTTRVITERGRAEVDFGQGEPVNLIVLEKNNLLETFDWVGVFGETFPKIKDRVERATKGFEGKALDYWHLAYAIAYRTDKLSKADLPRTWRDLADPKFKGVIAVDPRGYPFNFFAPVWGMGKVEEVGKAIGANQPIFQRGSPSIVASIVTGETIVGATSSIGDVDAAKAKGVPIDWYSLDEIPIAIEHAIVPKGAPHVNTARLWAAWITTEGRPLFEKLQGNGLAWPDEDSFLARKLKENNTKFSFANTQEELDLTEQALKRLSEIYLSR
jgi:iron(III) transport system substrate-binding protein